MQTIRTKWHKILPLIEEDEVYFTAPKEGTATHWSKFKSKPEVFKQFVLELGELPKFVIEKDLLEISLNEGFQQSIVDMKKAEVLRLPFPAMTVEFSGPKCHYLVYLRDVVAGGQLSWESPDFASGVSDGIQPFYGVVFRIQTDDKGEYLVISPTVLFIDIDEREGIPWLGLTGQSYDICDDHSKEFSELASNTYVKDSGAVWQALASALLVMSTAGVTHEVIDVQRLNRKREESNKPLIPRHTYVKIGRVYRNEASDHSDEYVPRRSPIPHLRRGHLKMVRFGAGRAQKKQVFIKPKLVAFVGEQEPTLQPKTYVVTGTGDQSDVGPPNANAL